MNAESAKARRSRSIHELLDFQSLAFFASLRPLRCFQNINRRSNTVELVCPAGSMTALKAAVDNGADAVYMGFRDGTNARNFPGLNFDLNEARQGIAYARNRHARVFLAINTYPRPHQWEKWCVAVDQAASLGVDALILADPGLMDYCVQRHPDLRLHLSVQ